jgi:hypothetical protein
MYNGQRQVNKGHKTRGKRMKACFRFLLEAGEHLRGNEIGYSYFRYGKHRM